MTSNLRRVVYFDPLAAGLEPSPKMRPYVAAYDYDGLATRLESFRDIQKRELGLMEEVERLRALVERMSKWKHEYVSDGWTRCIHCRKPPEDSAHETCAPQKDQL